MTDKQKRALAFIGPMWPGVDKETLTIHKVSDTSEERKKGLEEHWSITSKKELIEQIEHLYEPGQMAKYMEYHRTLLSLPEESIEYYINCYSNDEKKYKKLNIVNTYKYDLMNCGGLAFDTVRLVMLCRNGYIAEYITEDEAWEMILKTYDKFSPRFDSWAQYVLSHNAGRQFWLANTTADYTDKIYKSNCSLLFFDNSLYFNYLSIR